MLTGSAQWPYPVRYDQEAEADYDVLVVGGGIAGCHAAINAARRGARVAVLDKGPVIRSGSGGVEHPLSQRVGWKRKETGELYRIGMSDPPPPNTRPPVGGW